MDIGLLFFFLCLFNNLSIIVDSCPLDSAICFAVEMSWLKPFWFITMVRPLCMKLLKADSLCDNEWLEKSYMA